MMKTSLFIVLVGATLISCTTENKEAHKHEAHESEAATYTCPMHPTVVQDRPGVCPVCGMDLVPLTRPAESNDLMLTDSQVRLANVVTQKAEVKSIGQTLVINATLIANGEKTTTIGSRVAGRIEKLFVKETGPVVMQGEPLYEIYSETMLTLQREYLVALEQYQTLGKHEKRYEEFLKAAERKLLLYGLNKKQVEQLTKARMVQDRITLYAPVGGIVEEITVSEGQYVNEGDKLYRIEDLTSLWVEAELYPTETALVRLGDKVNVRVNGFENESITATVNFLSPEYQAGTQITIMRATLNNAGQRLKPGMPAQVFFMHSSRKALVVPVDAIIRDGKGTHVYVETGQNTFTPRMVKVGAEDFEQAEIISGLKENETVVISGAYLLYSELILKKGTDPMTGHTH